MRMQLRRRLVDFTDTRNRWWAWPRAPVVRVAHLRLRVKRPVSFHFFSGVIPTRPCGWHGSKHSGERVEYLRWAHDRGRRVVPAS